MIYGVWLSYLLDVSYFKGSVAPFIRSDRRYVRQCLRRLCQAWGCVLAAVWSHFVKWESPHCEEAAVSSSSASEVPKVASKPSPTPHCRICKQAHWLDSCSRFLELEIGEKIDYLNHTNHCCRCTRSYNMIDCRVNVRCDACHGRHHTSLHDAFHPHK